jgi:adenylate cyclase
MKTIKKLASVVVALLLVFFAWLSPLEYVDYALQDAFYQRLGLPDVTNIVLIGIDEPSLAELGEYQQWSRKLMADAINILNADEELKPQVIAVDVLYADERADKDADEALAEALRNGGNVVLASSVIMGKDRDSLSSKPVPLTHLKPVPALARYARHGYVNAIEDDDGVIRNTEVKMRFEDETLYSFASEVVQAYTGEGPDAYTQTHNEAYINYTGLPGDYFQLSFKDIFAEDFDPFITAGCIVLIGPWAMGLQDSHITPVSGRKDMPEQMYGVEIHANVIQMMLEGNYKERAPWGLTFAVLAVAVVVAMLLGELADIRVTFAVFAVTGAGYFWLARLLYDRGTVMSLIYVPVILAVVFIYHLVYGYIINTLEKARMRSTFKKYVDPKLVDKLIESREADSDEVGVKKHIAVLFVDVRGFTPMSEALRDTPELVVQTLNEYLELTASSVFNNGGSVDKFIGDATMALFNGFVPLDDYIFKAVKAAWDIVQGAARVNAALKEKYGVDVGFGVGVNCGLAIVGNLGPSFRKDYTAIGDTVNTTARLEANAKRSQVLISKTVYDELAGRIEAESIGEIPLKGKSIPLEVFSVTNVKA